MRPTITQGDESFVFDLMVAPRLTSSEKRDLKAQGRFLYFVGSGSKVPGLLAA
jgi:hypothetical protein